MKNADSPSPPLRGQPVRTPAELGRALRAERKRQGLTLQQLYAVTGLSTRFLSEFETGKANPSLGRAMDALQALGLELTLLPRGGTAGREPGSARRDGKPSPK